MGKTELINGIVTAVASTFVLAGIGYFLGKDEGEEEQYDSSRQQENPMRRQQQQQQQQTQQEEGASDIEMLVGTADMLVQQGRYPEAEQQYLSALKIVNNTTSPMTPDTTALAGLILHELGALYKFTDRLADADAAFGRSVHSFRSVVSSVMSSNSSNLPPPPPLSTAIEPLCKSLCEQAEVKTLRTRLVGGGTADSGEAKVLLIEAKKLAEEAVSLIETRLSMLKQQQQQSNSSSDEIKEVILRGRKQLADALRSLTQVQMFGKEWQKAEESIRRSISILSELGGGNNGNTSAASVTARMWLSQILLGQDRPSDACNVCRELVVCHKGKPEEGYFQRYLGEVLCDAEEYTEAEIALKRSLELYTLKHNSKQKQKQSSESTSTSSETNEQQESNEDEEDDNGREKWTAINDLATLYEVTGRTELCNEMLNEMKLNMKCDAPETSSRFLRTLQCGSRSTGNGQHTLFINVLVRERHSKKLPVGSFLVFYFQPPGEQGVVNSGLEKQIESDTKTIAVASPGFPGNSARGGVVRTIEIRVLASDHKTLLSTHTQLVRPEIDPNSTLILD